MGAEIFLQGLVLNQISGAGGSGMGVDRIDFIRAYVGVFNACQALSGYKVRRLPVVDRDEKLLGIVSVDDLVALLARELFNASQALEPSLSVKM